jgi:hypothetical protein
MESRGIDPNSRVDRTAFSLPYFDVRFVGAILVNARPKRNISATVVARR